MYSSDPDEDERAVQDRLIALVDGPAPVPPAAVPPQPSTPPRPTARPRDWLDDIFDEAATPAAAAEAPEPSGKDESSAGPRTWWSRRPTLAKDDDAEQPEPPAEQDEDPEEQANRPRAFQPHPNYWPRPHVPVVFTHAPERAAAAISAGTRRLLYNASAAGAGWVLGLYSRFAWALNDCGHGYGISGALVLGVGGSLLIAHVWDRRTRHWWPGIAWAARIPLATALVALALYAPAAP